MSDLVVTYWHGYGKPKLLVDRPDGTRVGYWDVPNDRARPYDRVDLNLLTQRIELWKRENPADVERLSLELPAEEPKADPCDEPEAVRESSDFAAGRDAHYSGRCNCAELIAERWHGYGTPRLIVKRSDQTRVGLVVLETGDMRPDDPDELAVLQHAYELYQARESDRAGDKATRGPKGSSNGQSGRRRAGAADQVWSDLAANPAGAEAGKRARELRDESPIRCIFDRMRGANTAERSWRRGAEGEKRVAALLQKVARKNPAWRDPLHAVVVSNRGTDIDHVFIGPGGVYTVNAKHHRDAVIRANAEAFYVDDFWNPYIKKSRREASNAAGLLSTACGFEVHVEALIVPVNARSVSVGVPADGVHVVEDKHLVRWFRERNLLYDDGTVQSIYEAARRSNVWKPERKR